jgi:hypothetical protein
LTALPAIFAAATALLAILAAVTALLFSCALPTLFLGTVASTAAMLVPESATSRAAHAMTRRVMGGGARIDLLWSCRSVDAPSQPTRGQPRATHGG